MIVLTVPLDRIQPAVPHIRCPKELAADIRRDGVQWPVVLLPDADRDGMFKVLDGYRRLDAARRAGHATIPARTRRALTYGQMHSFTLIAGLREPATPLPEVRAIAALRAGGYTPAEIAERLGYAKGVVTAALRIADLPDPVHDLIETGDLGLVDALDLGLRIRERSRTQHVAQPRAKVSSAPGSMAHQPGEAAE